MMRTFYVAIVLLFSTPAVAQDAALVFSALDTNKDGKISPAEAQRNVMVSDNFSAADTDHDGFLSKAEFVAAFGKSKPGKTSSS